MDGFYFTLLAVLLAGIGGRDQVLVANLTRVQGARPAVLVLALAISIATASFAAWAAITVAPLLGPLARQFFVAMALVFAGGESLLIRPRRSLREPTMSLGALAFAVLAFQLIDAARFLIFAMAIATGGPILAGIAGAVGGAVLVAAGWMAPDVFAERWVGIARRVIGAVLLAFGLWLAWSVLAQN
jgi:hypothetical protein